MSIDTKIRGPLHGAFSTPGLNSALLTVEILYDYMEDFNPGIEMLYVPAIGSNKKREILKDGCRKYETYRNGFFFNLGC